LSLYSAPPALPYILQLKMWRRMEIIPLKQLYSRELVAYGLLYYLFR